MTDPVLSVATGSGQNPCSSSERTTPWRMLHVIAIVGFVLRAAFACWSDYIAHPDELVQYLEQAHRLAFGQGFVAWEYRFGIRSWILPGLLSGLLSVFRALGIDRPALYIPLVKVVICAISTTLIYSAYGIARRTVSERAGRLAAIFVCFWYELICHAHKPTPEVLATYAICGAFALGLAPKRNAIGFGGLLGLAVVLRLQYVAVLPVAAVFLFVERWPWRRWLVSMATFCGLIVLAGIVDMLTWGRFLISYYNSYAFNQTYGVSSQFGVAPFWFYIARLTAGSAGLFIVATVGAGTRIAKTWLVLAIMASTLILHSLLPHKEYRFVFAVLPFWLIALAATVVVLQERHGLGWKRGAQIVIAVFGLASLAGSAYRVSHRSRQDVLGAYLWLNREPRLTAVVDLFSGTPVNSGGYYYLHRPIPIYFPLLVREPLPRVIDSVSHIVCSASTAPTADFETVHRIGALEIRRRVGEVKQPLLPGDPTFLFQKGIDDHYTPNVRPFPR